MISLPAVLLLSLSSGYEETRVVVVDTAVVSCVLQMGEH